MIDIIINSIKYKTAKPTGFSYLRLLIMVAAISILSSTPTYGQYTAKDDYLQENINQPDVSNDIWTASAGELDYSPKKKKKKKKRERREREEREPRTGSNNSSGNSLFSGTGAGFLKVFSFIILIILLAFLISKIVGGQSFVSNKKVDFDKQKAFDIKDVEANLHETELERYLRQATESGDYKSAIRIYYLMIIKRLSEQKLIHWKKDKTNSEYIKEMRHSQLFKSFRKVTRLFDYVWYSDAEIDKDAYAALQPDFNGFLEDIK